MDQSNNELDARGLNCPLPILKTRKAINDMQVGDTLRVITTDPGSVKDFPTFAKQTGHELIATEENDDEYIFTLRKTDSGSDQEE